MIQSSFITPEIFNKEDRIVALQTTRLGKNNNGLFPFFNLGESVGDVSQVVETNKSIFCNLMGFDVGHLAKSKQVHGFKVLKVDKPGRYEGFDAMITNVPEIILAVTVADCVPILLYSPVKGAVAAIHSGWKGTEKNIIGETIQAMQINYGVDPADIIAYIGACISKENYEVGPEVAFQFDSNYYKNGASENKYMLDLKAVCHNQLLSCGVVRGKIEVSEFCTVTHNDMFYSHRFEKGKTGRMLAAIVLKY